VGHKKCTRFRPISQRLERNVFSLFIEKLFLSLERIIDLRCEDAD